MTSAWSQSSNLASPHIGGGSLGQQALQKALEGLREPATSAYSSHSSGLLKAWKYDKSGELRARHSLKGDTGHTYDATGRILHTQHASLADVRNPIAQAANESFGYDPSGNLQDSATQHAINSSTAHPQRGGAGI